MGYEANSILFPAGVSRSRRTSVESLYTSWEILRGRPRGRARARNRLQASIVSGTVRDGMRRRLAALTVVGTLVLGQLLAYADPPDPTWISGFWDDADYDDVIVRVTSTVGASETGWLSVLAPHWVPIWSIPAADERHQAGPSFGPHPPRGPPLA